jgi:acetyltransferase-like isoleucine patch superfamily enzyme
MARRDLKWFLLLPYKATFYPPLSNARRMMNSMGWKWRLWRWRARWLRKNVSIYKTTVIRGAEDFQPKVVFGNGCVIDPGCTLWISDDPGNDARLELGANVYVARDCYLGAFQPLKIGADSLIGAFCYITSGNHKFQELDRPVRSQGYAGAPVILGRDVWVGAHVTILPGVTVGDKAIIGAGAVVTKSVPGGEIWAGVPAKKIGVRGP